MQSIIELLEPFILAWAALGADQRVLVVAGICGAVVQRIMAPRESWRRSLVIAIAGVLSAYFLAPPVYQVVSGFVDLGPSGLPATGFIIGASGQSAVRLIQDYITTVVPHGENRYRDTNTHSDKPENNQRDL